MQKNIIICGLDGVLNSFTPTTDVHDLDEAASQPFDDPDPVYGVVWTSIRLIRHLLNNMHANLGEPEVWIISGRSAAVRTETSAWLMATGIPCTKFIMREIGDATPEAEFKRRLLHNGTIPRNRIFCAFDAGDEVAQMWRSEGMTCYQSA